LIVEELYKIVDELEIIAKAHNTTVAQAALNYLLYKPNISSLIIGIRTANNLQKTSELPIGKCQPRSLTVWIASASLCANIRITNSITSIVRRASIN